MILKAPYVLALCEAAQQSSMVFGQTTRLVLWSNFQVDATEVIKSIVKFSPATESVAVEFLYEFQKVSRLSNLVASVLSGEAGEADADAHRWAQAVLMAVHDHDLQQLFIELKPVRDLASEYLTHLLIAVRNPGRERTPQMSECSTPDIVDWRSLPVVPIEELHGDAVIHRNNEALKKLLCERDGYNCPLTDYSFNPPPCVTPQCAHVLPFYLCNARASLRMIESFTGNQFSAEDFIENINHPRNAFLVQSDAHWFFDAPKWGIEATIVDGQTKYAFRQVGQFGCATICRRDGEEISFKGGPNGGMVDGPDAGYCNLRLAIARASLACGVTDIINKVYAHDSDEDEDLIALPTYFGGLCVSDEVLFRKLDDRLAPYA